MYDVIAREGEDDDHHDLVGEPAVEWFEGLRRRLPRRGRTRRQGGDVRVLVHGRHDTWFDSFSLPKARTSFHPLPQLMAPTQAEIAARVDVLARKKCTLIIYELELTKPSPLRMDLKGCVEVGQILRPSCNPAVASRVRFEERIARCLGGQRTPGFYYLLHEQGAAAFTRREVLVVTGTQRELMARGDAEEKRICEEKGGIFRGLDDKEPQCLNYSKCGQGNPQKRLEAKARAELDPLLKGVGCCEPGCEKQRQRPAFRASDEYGERCLSTGRVFSHEMNTRFRGFS
jgi:hypothetical protein